MLAGDYRLPIIPARIENVLPTGALRYQLTIRQYLDLFDDWDQNMAKLADQVRTMVAAKRNADKPGFSASARDQADERALWSRQNKAIQNCQRGRCGPALCHIELGMLNGWPNGRDHASFRMWDIGEHLAVQNLRMIKDRFHVVDWSAGHAGVVKEFDGLSLAQQRRSGQNA